MLAAATAGLASVPAGSRPGVRCHWPFGGYKMSGWGNELGAEGFDEYLNVKAVWINTD